jgi:yecA family protein
MSTYEQKDFGLDREALDGLARDLAVLQQEQIPAEYWHGYLCAIALSPTAVPEREWMTKLVNRESDEQTAEIEDDLREALKRILEALGEHRFKPYFPGDDADWRSCEPAQWCEGFLTASHHWPADLQEAAGGELLSLILPVILFHNPAEFFETQGGYPGETEREEMMDRSYAFLPEGLYEIPALWQEVLQEDLDDGDDPE